MSRLLELRSAVAVMLLVAMLAGCAGGAAGPSPSPTPAPITSPDEAVARVIATEPRLTGIEPFDTGLIGQSSWYTVEPGPGSGYVVDVRVGWGDCPAGCIAEHSWVYAVGPDGAVSVVSEGGNPVPADAWPSPIGAGRTGIGGIAVAGPVCPVETVPSDPACAPRPVVGAVIVIRDGGGQEVASVTTAADGSFFAELPAGNYVVEPQPLEGLMGVPGPLSITVDDGSAAAVQLEYDTGIR